MHLNRDIVKKLKECTDVIYLSPEAGNDKILRLLNKAFTVSLIREKLQLLYEYGVSVKLHCMYGIPGERKRDVIKSFKEIGEWIKNYGVKVHFQKYVPKSRMCAYVHQRHNIDELFRKPINIQYYQPLFEYIKIIQNKDVERKLIINVSYKCNNKCIFCSVGDRERVDGDINYQIKIINDYRKKGYELLDIDGGEPLLYPHLKKLINFATLLGYKRITITTNGKMFYYREVVESLKKFKNLFILISLHSSNKRKQEFLTSTKLSFIQTITGIKNVVNMFDHNKIGINTTITSYNYTDILYISQLLCTLGVKTYNIQYYTPFGVVNSALIPPKEKLKRHLIKTIDYCEHNNIQVNLINFEFCIAPELAKYMYSDYYKSERYMLFTNGQIVNLSEYLSKRRIYRRDCYNCEFEIFCKGHWIYGKKD